MAMIVSFSLPNDFFFCHNVKSNGESQFLDKTCPSKIIINFMYQCSKHSHIVFRIKTERQRETTKVGEEYHSN